jgi:hypothetical protein
MTSKFVVKDTFPEAKKIFFCQLNKIPWDINELKDT